MPRNAKHSIEVINRRIKAIELRKAGLTYDQIAEELGYASRTGAHAAVVTGLKAAQQGPAEELRTLELERIDALWTVVFPTALTGDLKAVDRCIRLSARRSALLGLDMPKSLIMAGFLAVDSTSRIESVERLAALPPEELTALLVSLVGTAPTVQDEDQ